MRELIIMQGGSGSGKTFIREALVAKYEAEGITPVVCSTDDFWYSQVGDDAERYDFDMSRLGEAHKWNQNRANDAMRANARVVIIDNTNTNQREASPYINMGKANGYNLRYVSVGASLEVAHAANAERPDDRRVPEEVIERQRGRLRLLDLD